MAGDGVAVIDMAKVLRVERNLAATVQRYSHLLGFEVRDRAEFAINYSFICERSAKLDAITFGKGSLRFLVDAHTGKTRRVISEYAAIIKANRDLVRLVISACDRCIVANIHFVDLAGVVVTDNVLAGSVGVGERAFGARHILPIDVDLHLLLGTAYSSLMLKLAVNERVKSDAFAIGWRNDERVSESLTIVLGHRFEAFALVWDFDHLASAVQFGECFSYLPER